MRKRSLDLNKEERLFVLIAESVSSISDIQDESIEKVTQLLRDDFDWDYFLKLAKYHNYLAASYRFFFDIGILDELEERVKKLLENEYLLAQARFLKKESELLEVLNALADRGIDPIVFKGIPQACLFYRDPGIRVAKDIDVLVKPSQIEDTKQILLDRGYKVYSGLRTEESYRKYHFHLIFTRGESMDIVIEVHWSLLSPQKGHTIDYDIFQENTSSFNIQEKTLKTFNTPFTLWFLSVHLSYKSFFDFRTLIELKRLASEMREDGWDFVLALASNSNTLEQLKLALSISESLLGKYLKPNIEKRLKPGFFKKYFIQSTYYPRGLIWDWVPFYPTHELVVSFALRKGLKRKLAYLYRLTFPNESTLFEVYSGRLDVRRYYKHKYSHGMFVLFKVIVLTLTMGVLIRTNIIGKNMLDPTKHIIFNHN